MMLTVRSLLLPVAVGGAALVAAGSAAGARPPASPNAIAKCFESRRVLVDPGAAVYLPPSVVPRSRQVALSFVFVPKDVVPGLAAIVVVSPTQAAAAKARARIIRFAGRGGLTPENVLRAAIQRRGSSVLMWLSKPNSYVQRMATACLGPVGS